MKTREKEILEILKSSISYDNEMTFGSDRPCLSDLEALAKEIAELVKQKGQFEKIYMNTDIDFPENEGEYITKMRDSIIPICINPFKKTDFWMQWWMINIEWYFYPVDPKELDVPSKTGMTTSEINGLRDILNEFSKDKLTYKRLKETGNSEGEHKEFYRGKYEAYNRAWTILKRYMLWHSIIDKE